MGALFSIIILKRVLLDTHGDLLKLGFHLLVIAIFMTLLRFHQHSHLMTRAVPLLVGGLSYYGHTQFMKFGTRFAALPKESLPSAYGCQ